MLHDELDHVLAQRPDLVLVNVADGARDNWGPVSRALPDGIEVVDFYHAAEHLRLALSVAYGETSPKGLAPFENLRHVLLQERDGVRKIIGALRYPRDRHPRRTRIQTELTYFRRHRDRDRMRYAGLRADHLAIGSGVTEAAWKTLGTRRLKGAGMRSAEHGGQAILTLRSPLQSDRFDSAWDLLLQPTRPVSPCPRTSSHFAQGRASVRELHGLLPVVGALHRIPRGRRRLRRRGHPGRGRRGNGMGERRDVDLGPGMLREAGRRTDATLRGPQGIAPAGFALL